MSEKNTRGGGVRPSDGTVRRMAGLFAGRRGALALTALLTVAVVVGTLSLPVLSGRAVDCVVGPGEVDFAGLRGALASRSERCRFTERPLTVRSTFEKLPCNVGTYGGHHVREGL